MFASTCLRADVSIVASSVSKCARVRVRVCRPTCRYDCLLCVFVRLVVGLHAGAFAFAVVYFNMFASSGFQRSFLRFNICRSHTCANMLIAVFLVGFVVGFGAWAFAFVVVCFNMLVCSCFNCYFVRFNVFVLSRRVGMLTVAAFFVGLIVGFCAGAFAFVIVCCTVFVCSCFHRYFVNFNVFVLLTCVNMLTVGVFFVGLIAKFYPGTFAFAVVCFNIFACSCFHRHLARFNVGVLPTCLNMLTDASLFGYVGCWNFVPGCLRSSLLASCSCSHRCFVRFCLFVCMCNVHVCLLVLVFVFCASVDRVNWLLLAAF